MTYYFRIYGKLSKDKHLKLENNMEQKNFFSEMKAIAEEFSAREWVAIVAGVIIFILVASV